MSLFVSDIGCSVPPLVYGSLLIMCTVQVIFLFNEGVILVQSGRGSIWNNTSPRKHITKFVYVRGVVAVFELCGLVLASVAIWLHSSVHTLLACPSTTTALHFTRAVIFLHWIIFLCFLLKTLFYVDPLGCFSPGLLEHISLLDSSQEQATLHIKTDGETVAMATSKEDVLLTRQVSYWISGREQFLRRISNTGGGSSVDRVSMQGRSGVSQSKVKRRLSALFCCLCTRDKRSVGVALEEVAMGFYTIFGDSDSRVVLTDVIAGLRLLHYDQKSNQNLSEKFRKV